MSADEAVDDDEAEAESDGALRLRVARRGLDEASGDATGGGT